LALAGGISPTGDDVVTVTVARERQILQLVAEGKTTKAIGELLGITFKTAATRRQSGTALAEASRSRNAMNCRYEFAGIP